MCAASTRNLLMQCSGEGLLAEAWARVYANAGCPGVDGVSVAHYHAAALSHLAELRADVLAGGYRAQPLLGIAIPKDNGRLRHLAIPTVRDRVLQTAVAQVLTRLIDPDFDDASFAYRSGRSVQQATARIVACRDQGLCWVVDADIQAYFDNIPHQGLLSMLRRRLPDDSLTPLLAQWLAAPVMEDGALQPRRRGVPQGSPLSPLLSNLYLHPLDCALAEAGYTLVRYADDFLVLCHSKPEAEAGLTLVRQVLGQLQLALNEEKTRVTHFQAGFRFLGVRFEGQRVSPVCPDAGAWVLPPAAPLPDATAPEAGTPAPRLTHAGDMTPVTEDDAGATVTDPEAVRLDDEGDGLELPRSVYITTQGVHVARERERLIVSRNREVIGRVPLRLIDQIALHGNALISTAVIRYCHEHQIGLAFADANGINPAILEGTPETSVALLTRQVKRQDDAAFGLAFAKACIEGKLHNCRAVLRNFSRRDAPDCVARAMAVLEHSLRSLARTNDLNTLRGHEGRAARAYFFALGALIPENWGFSGRNRMPPQDPVNALLSYGYAVLSHTMHAAIRMACLHAGFGHLHAIAPNRPALVCDLIEEFRPLVVDAVVLTMIRKHSIDPQTDFALPAQTGGVCRLQAAAKQLFIARLEAKLAAPLACPEGSGKTCLLRMMRAQVARYAGSLGNAAAYRPYLAP